MLLIGAKRSLLVQRQFTPSSFFSNNEQGVWYEPSLTNGTLFQDSAGTTPVTAVEQPVGLMLDKSGRGNHAFIATAIDRPILRQDAGGRYYLACNGANTWMQTNSIDFTATGKVTVFAGVRKLSDAATGMFVELSPAINTSPGSFALRTPHTAGANYAFLSNGTILGGAVSGNSYPAPISNVLTAVGDISGDSARLRINGLEVPGGVGDQGTGNYGNYPLYLFRRGGTSLPFNGSFYGLLIRGALTSDAQIAAMERWLAPKTGVTIP